MTNHPRDEIGTTHWYCDCGEVLNSRTARDHQCSKYREIVAVLRWFVDKSNHEGFCGSCPPANSNTCQCDWPEMKAKAETLLNSEGGGSHGE